MHFPPGRPTSSTFVLTALFDVQPRRPAGEAYDRARRCRVPRTVAHRRVLLLGVCRSQHQSGDREPRRQRQGGGRCGRRREHARPQRRLRSQFLPCFRGGRAPTGRRVGDWQRCPSALCAMLLPPDRTSCSEPPWTGAGEKGAEPPPGDRPVPLQPEHWTLMEWKGVHLLGSVPTNKRWQGPCGWDSRGLVLPERPLWSPGCCSHRVQAPERVPLPCCLKVGVGLEPMGCHTAPWGVLVHPHGFPCPLGWLLTEDWHRVGWFFRTQTPASPTPGASAPGPPTHTAPCLGPEPAHNQACVRQKSDGAPGTSGVSDLQERCPGSHPSHTQRPPPAPTMPGRPRRESEAGPVLRLSPERPGGGLRRTHWRLEGPSPLCAPDTQCEAHPLPWALPSRPGVWEGRGVVTSTQ